MVTALMIADSKGRERAPGSRPERGFGEPDGWVTQQSGVMKSSKRATASGALECAARCSTRGSTGSTSPSYVPNERPWFVGAMSNASDDEIYRSEPYQFFERKPCWMR